MLGAAAHRAGGRRQGRARRDAAVGRRRHPRARCGAPGPCASACRCAWSSSPAGPRTQASRAGTSTWSPRAGWPPTSSRPPTPAWPSCWAATASATAGGSCACPARATSRADARGAGVAWWPATCTRRRSTSSRSWARCLTTRRGPGVGARRADRSRPLAAGRARSARVVRAPRARPADQRVRLRAAARCTTTTSPRSSSTTSRATGGIAGRARAAATSSSTRHGVGMDSRAAASMHHAFARSSPVCRPC